MTNILRDALTGDNCNHEFVRCAEIGDGVGDQEEGWLRLLLQEHFRLTGSQRARRLLTSTRLAAAGAPGACAPAVRDRRDLGAVPCAARNSTKDAEVSEVVGPLPLQSETMRQTSESAC